MTSSTNNLHPESSESDRFQQWINGTASSSLEVENQDESSGVLDVVKAIAAMNQARALWVKESDETRYQRLAQAIAQFSVRLTENVETIAQLLYRDIGTNPSLVRSASVPAAVLLLKKTQSIVEAMIASKEVALGVGHSAIFFGWSDPLVQFCRRVPISMVSGFGVCIKPSRRAPLMLNWLSKTWIECLGAAGVPVGLFASLNGSHSDESSVGGTLLRHPGIKAIQWIGESESAKVAHRIAIESSQSGSIEKRFQFSGSGRNPLILFSGYSEFDLDRIADQITRSTRLTHTLGPYRASRIFVQESLYKAFVDRLSDRFKRAIDDQEIKSNLPTREAERFKEQTRLALSETGRLVVGGESHTPTLIRDLTNCSTLQSQELAGPWITIASFKYQHEALKYANTSPLGLAGFVLHPDLDKAKATAQKLEVGLKVLSASLERPEHWAEALACPVHGVKDSGLGPQGLQDSLQALQWQGAFLSDSPL